MKKDVKQRRPWHNLTCCLTHGVPSWSCWKAVYKPVWHIPLLSVQWINSWWWTDELSEICRVSCQNKFVRLVHLVGFITKKFVTMHGHMNVKKWMFQIFVMILATALLFDVSKFRSHIRPRGSHLATDRLSRPMKHQSERSPTVQ
jgi:hypothetical protein